MKLLFDQNISPRIVKRTVKYFPGSTHVRQEGLEDASDSAIFDFARKNAYTIVTFDADFIDLNTVKGIPPKVIWLRTGNMTTVLVAELLRKNRSVIREFLKETSGEILELDQKF